MTLQHEVETTRKMCNRYLELLTKDNDTLSVTYAELYVSYKHRFIEVYEMYQQVLKIIQDK